jgi:predicted transcriptional regulator
LQVESALNPLEYTIYGILWAAKRETGPEGARRLYRIQERADCWDEVQVRSAVIHLMELGWVRQIKEEIGFVYYEPT